VIRYSKLFFTNPAQISISGIKCSCDNLIKISDIFNCKLFSLTIDSITSESSLLKFIKEKDLKYAVKQSNIDSMEISVIVPNNLYSIVLNKAIREYPENIFIFNLLNPVDWDKQLCRCFEEIVKTGVTDVYISISLDENSLLISLNKSLIFPKEVYKKIKSLHFE